MAINLENTRNYRLIYFQPDPEDGERVCIGLLFHDQDQYSLIYDSSFPKLSCISPRHEKAILKFYLDDLEQSLRHASPNEVELILRKSGPQIITSAIRTLLVPLTNTIKQRLLERFVLNIPHHEIIPGARMDAQKRDNPVEESIVDFLKDFLSDNQPDVIFQAKSKQVIGKNLPNVSPVAASIRLPGRIILIDGVDMNVATARQVINRVNRVTHTFWEYGRAEQDYSLSKHDSLKRVALVLNGRPQYSLAQKDAHDFALHQFGNESDLIVTERAGQELRNLLKN